MMIDDIIKTAELHGSEGLKKFCLANKIDINSYFPIKDERCSEEWSPLAKALKDGNFKAAKALVLAGADVNFPYTKYRECYPIHFAAMQGSVEMLSFLMSHGADKTLNKPLQGASYEKPRVYGYQALAPILYALANDNVEVVDFFLKAGASVEHFDCTFAIKDESLIELAAYFGSYKVLKYLLTAGAEFLPKQEGIKEKLLAKAVGDFYDGHFDGVTFFDRKKDRTQNKLNCAALLLLTGIDLNAWKNYHLEPFLHVATDSSNVSMPLLILMFGAKERNHYFHGSPLYKALKHWQSKTSLDIAYALILANLNVKIEGGGDDRTYSHASRITNGGDRTIGLHYYLELFSPWLSDKLLSEMSERIKKKYIDKTKDPLLLDDMKILSEMINAETEIETSKMIENLIAGVFPARDSIKAPPLMERELNEYMRKVPLNYLKRIFAQAIDLRLKLFYLNPRVQAQTLEDGPKLLQEKLTTTSFPETVGSFLNIKRVLPLEYYSPEKQLELIEKEGPEGIQALVDSGIPLNMEPKGESLLHVAVRKELKKAIASLIQQGADVNAKDEHGYSPIMLAYRNYDFDTIERLIKAGAKGIYDNFPRPYEKTGFFHICANEETYERYEREPYDDKLEKMIKMLLEKGGKEVINANGGDTYQNWTPLMACIIHRNYNTAKCLIENGADITLKDKKGRTALDLLKESEEIEERIAKDSWGRRGRDVKPIFAELKSLIEKRQAESSATTSGAPAASYSEESKERKLKF